MSLVYLGPIGLGNGLHVLGNGPHLLGTKECTSLVSSCYKSPL